MPGDEVREAAIRWGVTEREAAYRLATPYEGARRRERAMSLAFILENERFEARQGEMVPPVIAALTRHVDALVEEGIERVLTLVYGPEEES